MKMKGHFLAVTVAVVICCVYSLVNAEGLLPEPELGLIAGPNPALAAIDRLNVVIVSLDDQPGGDGPDWKELKAKVEDKLVKGGVRISSAPDKQGLIDCSDMPELRVYADMLKLEDLEFCVFRVQVALARNVHLTERYIIKPDVWNVKPAMGTVSVKGISEKLNSTVLDQVDEFMRAYVAARAVTSRPADRTGAICGPVAAATAPSRSTPAKCKYVASKNSRVFHKSTCSSTARIKPANMVTYSTREEAIGAGKRPCKRCKP